MLICVVLMYFLAGEQSSEESPNGPKAYYRFLWIIGTMLYLVSVLIARFVDRLL